MHRKVGGIMKLRERIPVYCRMCGMSATGPCAKVAKVLQCPKCRAPAYQLEVTPWENSDASIVLTEFAAAVRARDDGLVIQPTVSTALSATATVRKTKDHPAAVASFGLGLLTVLSGEMSYHAGAAMLTIILAISAVSSGAVALAKHDVAVHTRKWPSIAGIWLALVGLGYMAKVLAR